MLKTSSASLNVAPFTGAWIETGQLPLADYQVKVAPFTGAWIETYGIIRHKISQLSPPSRGGCDFK